MLSDLETWRQLKRTEFGAAWRKQLVMRFVAGGSPRPPVEFDALMRQAVKYFRRVARGASAAAERNDPDLAAAEVLWGQTELRCAVQSLVLANVDAAEICGLLQLESSVLQILEALYWDVRPMLAAEHWIVARVITPEGDAGRDDVAARLRVAYFGGPYAAKSLLEARQRLPSDPSQQLADAALLLHAKAIQATEMPLSPDQSLEYLKLMTEMRHSEQLLQLERRKLAFRQQRWTQRYELALARRGIVPATTPGAADDPANPPSPPTKSASSPPRTK
jgi:hypothetical protein